MVWFGDVKWFSVVICFSVVNKYGACKWFSDLRGLSAEHLLVMFYSLAFAKASVSLS